MKKIGFGILGAGAIATSSCQEIISHSGAEIVAASDINSDRLQQLKKQFDIPLACADFETLLDNPAIDAVYIAVPNKYHAEFATRALLAGKHVMLEKPFAMNIAEAKAVAELAKKQQRVMTIGMNLRFHANAQSIKRLVEAGSLGSIYHAKAHWLRRTGIPRLGTWFGHRELSGGGALLDIGVHLLDLALYIVDNFQPLSVYGSSYANFGHQGLAEGDWGNSIPEGLKFDVEDFATALIKMKGGASLSLDVSWALHQAKADKLNVEFFGEQAGASVFPPQIYQFGSQPDEYAILDVSDADPAYPHYSRFHNFINHIRGEESLCVTLDQALAVQNIVDAIYQSCQTGHEVILASPDS